MNSCRRLPAFVLLLFSLPWRLSAQQPAPWRDPSPHTIQFITVDEKNNVKLEVLDWRGSGRPLVLLAGLGATAHIFDEFAPKLTSMYHVYGITRRGFGASSAPAPQNGNYSADRLGDDVLAVLDALKLDRPVLVGHSIAGEELSSVGTRHPERVAGLIYLDAAYSFAYYDRSLGDLNIDSQDLQEKLSRLQTDNPSPDQKQLVGELLRDDLPQLQSDLQQQQKKLEVPEPKSPTPSAADRESFQAAISWFKSVYGWVMPEAELRQEVEATPEGHIGKNHAASEVRQAIISGEQKYTNIRGPVLAIFAVPHDLGPFSKSDPVARAYVASDLATTEAQIKAFQTGVPSARVVRLPNVNHSMFISDEGDVLREVRAFVAGLH